MLKTRVITGAVLSAIVATVLIFSHIPWVLNIAIAVLSVQSIYELYNATNLKKYKWLQLLTYAAALALSFVTLPHYVFIIMPVFVLSVIIFTMLCANVEDQKQIPHIAPIFLALAFTFFFKTMSYLRQLNGGAILLGCVVLTPVITDISAYFIGKGFGKHKLAPTISPKKTIEGCIGGTLVAVIVLTAVVYIMQSLGHIKINIGLTVLYLVLASFIGQLGDLALSSIKRIVGIKDYGKLLPGHGGFLDRFDSLVFVLPFTLIFCYVTDGFIL